MKKIIITAIAIIAIACLSFFVLDVYNDNRLVAKDSLPKSIVDFIDTNFPETNIRSAEIDFLDYGVWLEDDTYVEFKWNREWDKIERHNASVPSQLMPAGITSFIKEKYPESMITKVSIDDSRYEVNISNNYIELIFNKQGNYIGIDK